MTLGRNVRAFAFPAENEPWRLPAVRGLGLLIERKLGESFYVGEVKITVVRLGDKRVKVRVHAPLSMHIARAEDDGSHVRGAKEDPT